MTSIRELADRSMAAVAAGDKEAWLALFADDAVVEDPIGPSAFDPEGKGHRGRDAIAAFFDTVIAPNESITFTIAQSFLCGDEVANVGVIRIVLAGGAAVEVDGVYTYRRSGDDRIAALRAYWEPAGPRARPRAASPSPSPDAGRLRTLRSRTARAGPSRRTRTCRSRPSRRR